MKWNLIVTNDVGDEIVNAEYDSIDELMNDTRVLCKPSMLGVYGYQFIIVPFRG